MSGFSFKGVHSSKFGIYTQDQSRTLLPPKREGKITIPGRSGYYDDVGAVYNERAESVLCSFVCPEGKTVPEVCREIAYWLSGSGRLIFDREPDKYYLARLSGGPPMSQHLKYGEFTITWSYLTGNLSRAWKTKVLNILRGQSIQGIAPYFSLWNGSPEAGGSELSGDNYARAALTFGAPAEQTSGQIIARNSVATAFNRPSTAWGTWTHSAIYSASSSGEPVYIKALVESVEIKKGYMPTIAEAAIEVGIN